MDAENPIAELTSDECWEMLRQHSFGRLAFHLVGEVHITPINYAVDGQNRIIFITSEGSKLFGVTANKDVAFEVDEIVDDRATSVIIRGRAKILEGQERYIIEQLPIRPWVPSPKSVVVAVEVDEISGRSFDLSRPWLHDIPHTN